MVVFPKMLDVVDLTNVNNPLIRGGIESGERGII